MTNELIETIVSKDASLRNRSINSLLQGKNKDDLLKLAEELETFRKSSNNLYHKVRASLFLFVIYRFYLQENKKVKPYGNIPLEGVTAANNKDFNASIDVYLNEIKKGSLNGAVCSALAHSYYQSAFGHLLNQVKLSISQCWENSILFDTHTLNEYPYRVSRELTNPDPVTGLYPVGADSTPVRIDPSHSEWSDIFFLGMDFPEGARVVNISVNLGIYGSKEPIMPPCECYSRFTEESVIHLRSIDLGISQKISSLREIFNFDGPLSLLKSGVAASGIIPPSFEGKNIQLKDLLYKLLGKPGGIEIATRVNYIPKGSRLAVSTILLSTIIARLMRFSGQIDNHTGCLKEKERRLVASRAILGEWLGGSGGGWQDSGGLWPGIKVITGEIAKTGSPEYGISRGCLLPNHKLFTRDEIPKKVEEKIIKSLVLIHGGISQDIGPVLEMVTERYLLRYEKEWQARIKGIKLFDKIVEALKKGDMKKLGRLTTKDWEEAIQPIIPWVNTAFTEELIRRMKKKFKENYWGFLMLGGSSGGGMAFIVNPLVREKFKKRVAQVMMELKTKYQYALPFVIDPLVYDFEINHEGNTAKLLRGRKAEIPEFKPINRQEIMSSDIEFKEETIKRQNGFNSDTHNYLKSLYKKGKISLSGNRLSPNTKIEDVSKNEVFHFEKIKSNKKFYKLGAEALKRNEIAVVSLAGGLGSRWAEGSSMVKSINPFVKINKKFRTFIEIHLAKSKKTEKTCGKSITHVFTTSYLTHKAIEDYLKRFNYHGYNGKIILSQGKSIAHRVYPAERDLRFLWERHPEKQDYMNAMIKWAASHGEGEDYTENKPLMRFNPPGHWYEIPNMIKNGVLAQMIKNNPELKYLLCHNIDTLGANIEPSILGTHIAAQSCMSFEVIPRRIEDRGGGLAKIDGHVQLIEGLALPEEKDQYTLSFYNSLTNWITIDLLLEFFGLNRDMIINVENTPEIHERITNVEKRIPTYVTLKNVKQVSVSGQETICPVAQFEKLWGDMTGLRDLKISYVVVPRYRGQQLKDPSLLDTWLRDGSFEHVKGIAYF